MVRPADQSLRPSYLDLHETGELARRVEEAYDLISCCRLCPRQCGVNRLEGERGACQTGRLPVVSSYGPHYGEEPPFTGWGGSGTIFFTNCNLQCVYCQNYQISQQGCGREVGIDELAGMMLLLQEKGCHNINLVSPTHVVPQILAALAIAASRGLMLPLVYNTGTYDAQETLTLLERVIDIYMPDTKYGSEETGRALSGVAGYPGVMMDALREMHRQAGDLVCRDHIAVRGLIIRHLVLPENLADSANILGFIAKEISRESYVNVMAQYHPAWKILVEKDEPLYRPMRRGITHREYDSVVSCAKEVGLHRGFSGEEQC